MGYRENNDIDEPSEEALRRALSRLGSIQTLEPPPDVVARTMRRLPSAPPAAAARATARRRMRRLTLLVIGSCLIIPFAFISLLSVFGLGPSPALLIGDGSSGLSRLLLVLQLLSKPLLGAIVSVAPELIVGSLVVALMSGWLWWKLVQQKPAYAVAETRR